MGTSINHASPPTAGWKAVAACYAEGDVPVERVAKELWRAVTHQGDALQKQLDSPVISKLLNLTSTPSLGEAQDTIGELAGLKGNTILGEFAKRALLIKAGGGFPNESTITVFFRQLTNYYVARDLPGAIGTEFRCKSTADQRAFKSQLSDIVAFKVEGVVGGGQSQRPVQQYLPTILRELQR